MSNLCELPMEILQTIAKIGGPTIALRLSECCREMYESIQTNELWKTFCNYYWIQNAHNVHLYHGDYKRLYRNRNGWFPKRYITNLLEDTQSNDIHPSLFVNLFPLSNHLSTSGTLVNALSSSVFFETTQLTEQDLFLKKSQTISVQHHIYQPIDDHHDPNNNQSTLDALNNITLQAKTPQYTTSVAVHTSSQWISELPKFSVAYWLECPNGENIMDCRLTHTSLLSVTAGWKTREKMDDYWIPPPPKQLNVTECYKDLSSIWHYRFHNDPTYNRVSDQLTTYSQQESNTCNSVVSSYPVQQSYQTGQYHRLTSHICIRDLETLQLTQRLSIESGSINCIDGGNVEINDSQLFVLGNENGTIIVMKQDLYDQYTIQTLQSQTNHLPLGSGDNLNLREINDLRLTHDHNTVIGIRTVSRYPSCLEILDLSTQHSQFLPPFETSGYWIHAVELGTYGSLQEVYAVGESSSTGMFSILIMDLRIKKRVQTIYPKTRQMLWPMRVSNDYIFANCVIPIWETGGLIIQLDKRKMGESSMLLTHKETVHRMCTDNILGLYPSGNFRTEDFQCNHEHLYIYGIESGRPSVYRSSFKNKNIRERLLDIDGIMNLHRLGNSLKLFHCDERGWVGTYASSVYRGRLTK